MSVDIEGLRNGAATNLAAVSGMRVYPRLPGQIQTPAAVVETGSPLVDRDEAMGRGLALVRLTVTVLVSSSNVDRAQRNLDAYVDTVVNALLADRTLGGSADDVRVPTVSGYVEIETGQSTYMGFRADVEALVNDS
jgi:hypothetical protein